MHTPMNSTDNNELRELRQQVEMLREMLGKEEIVSERMLRRTMSTKAGTLRRRSVVLIITALILIPYSLWAFPFLGLPPVIGYVVAAFALVAAIYDTILFYMLPDRLFSRGSLMEILSAAVRYKKMHLYWLFVGIPFLLLFVATFYHYTEGNVALHIGMYVGLILGTIFGVRTLSNTLRTTQEIIDQIRDISDR